jgi:hypothetical protein
MLCFYYHQDMGSHRSGLENRLDFLEIEMNLWSNNQENRDVCNVSQLWRGMVNSELIRVAEEKKVKPNFTYMAMGRSFNLFSRVIPLLQGG